MSLEHPVAADALGSLALSPLAYGRDAQNRLAETVDRSVLGARAALETFYCAFNNGDIDLLRSTWLDDPLVQLNNPLGGLIRGLSSIVDLYGRVFRAPGEVWVRFEDVLELTTPATAVFAGREIGNFAGPGDTVPLSIRTSRFFTYAERAGGWRQVHHHGSIDDSELLARYQAAVNG